MEVLFGTGFGTAVLESPVYNINQSVYLKFNYQLSMPGLALSVAITTQNSTSFVAVCGWLYSSEMNNVTRWYNASCFLSGGITQIRFIVDKFGMTSGDATPYVKMYNSSLVPADECYASGMLSRLDIAY